MFHILRKISTLALLVSLASCAAAPRPPPDPGPRQALESFLAAERAQDFDRVYALLASPLRSRYTPARLRSDYVRDRDLAQDKLARIRAALAQGIPARVEGDRAALPLGGDRAARLVHEPDGWRVESLE